MTQLEILFHDCWEFLELQSECSREINHLTACDLDSLSDLFWGFFGSGMMNLPVSEWEKVSLKWQTTNSSSVKRFEKSLGFSSISQNIRSISLPDVTVEWWEATERRITEWVLILPVRTHLNWVSKAVGVPGALHRRPCSNSSAYMSASSSKSILPGIKKSGSASDRFNNLSLADPDFLNCCAQVVREDHKAGISMILFTCAWGSV